MLILESARVTGIYQYEHRLWYIGMIGNSSKCKKHS